MPKVHQPRLCAGCLAQNGRLFPLEDHQLVEEFFFMVGYSRLPTDTKLLCSLCPLCFVQLKRYSTFRRNCLESMRLMKDYFLTKPPKKRKLEHKFFQDIHLKLKVSLTIDSQESFCYDPFKEDEKSSCNDFDDNEYDDFENDPLLDTVQVEEVPIKFECKSERESEQPYNDYVEWNEPANGVNCVKEPSDDEEKLCDEKPRTADCPELKNTKVRLNANSKIKFKVKKLVSKKGQNTREYLKNNLVRRTFCSHVIKNYLTNDEHTEELKSFEYSENYLEAPYKCELCTKPFFRQNVYKNHLLTHQQNSGQYICDVCSQRFKTLGLIARHVSQHFLRFTCQLCDETYNSKISILRHIFYKHTDINSFKCDLCDKIYKSPVVYTNHMKKHGELWYNCVKCSEVFKTKLDFKHHMTRHVLKMKKSKKNKQNEKKKCDLCLKEFNTQVDFNKHLSEHPNEKRFHCAVCNLFYVSQDKLDVHLKIGARHLQAAQFMYENCHACTVCDKRFAVRHKLALHMKNAHVKDRSYECDLCNRKYKNKDSLQSHIRLYHTNRVLSHDHICETCGKAYKKKINLKQHMYSHTGERPFKCQYCDAAFANSGTCSSHVKTVHLGIKKKRKEKIKSVHHIN